MQDNFREAETNLKSMGR